VLVFGGVRMVGTGRFEKFLKMVFPLSRIMLQITLSRRDILLVRAARFSVVIITAGSDCDSSKAPLLPPFVALSAFLSAFASAFGRCCPVTMKDYFSMA
jgi:hypothetical protein